MLETTQDIIFKKIAQKSKGNHCLIRLFNQIF